jgi:SAM-dependent MidA family methyltransferase
MTLADAGDDTPAALARRVQASRLVMEHEMGELFKVIGFATPDAMGQTSWGRAAALGFASGDRTHAL